MLKVLKDVRVSDVDQVRYIKFKFSKGSYKSRSVQNLMAFDIETSNGWRQPDCSVIGFDHDRYNNDENYRHMIDEGEAMSLMYVWQIAIESENKPMVFMGRTWEEFDEFMSALTDEMRRQAVFGYKSIDRDAELYVARNDQRNVNCKIYIHNLGFEFQHLRNLYNNDFAQSGRGNHGSVSGVFARQTRKPMKCSINKNRVRVEFRDSLVLTQKSLKSWCKDEKLPVQKLSEPKDYYLEMRTPETVLTDEEIQYSINDVVSMLYGLEKYREKYVKLSDIPLTQTGAVRIKCRERVCMTNPKWAARCTEITKKYTPDDFKKLCQLFQGGWTHANSKYVGMVMKNVVCFDFASSYPAVMTTRTYPIGEFKKVDVSNFDALASQDINFPDYRWYAKIKVKNFRTCLNNTLWSSSKVCIDGTHPMLEDAIVDNGRIFSASEMTTYMTDLDYDTFKKAYTVFDGIEVLELYRAESGYLCKEIITTILEYFAYKTSLKGDPDAESLYNESKQFVNSIYGCSVTKLISDPVFFTKNGWESKPFTDGLFQSTIEETKPENTFLAYQMGVWVTAWARHNLWDFIIKLDKRVIYCDTDSIKGVFTDEDIKFVEEYNQNIEKIENYVASVMGFDPAMYTPQTKTGKVKRLGIMEREDDCEEFKTLGAKRYVDLIDGKIHCTIAGLPKSAGENKLKSVSEFDNNIVWNTQESEKLIAKYNDKQTPAKWTDRDGNIHYSEDRFGICLQPTTFDLSISGEFEKFLAMLTTGEINRQDEFFSDTPSFLM